MGDPAPSAPEGPDPVLANYLEAQGGAVTRSTRLVGLEPGEDAVNATFERDGERREVVAQWVVGCDGFRSAVREAVGIEFPGADIDAPWAVFDATLEGWNDEYDIVSAHLDRPPVIPTPLPHRRWRVYLRPTSETSDLVPGSPSGGERSTRKLSGWPGHTVASHGVPCGWRS